MKPQKLKTNPKVMFSPKYSHLKNVIGGVFKVLETIFGFSRLKTRTFQKWGLKRHMMRF